jgi:hypothetical protein
MSIRQACDSSADEGSVVNADNLVIKPLFVFEVLLEIKFGAGF